MITLGQEALDAIVAVADRVSGVQRRLEPTETYGRRGEVTIGASSVQLLPLAHPGFLRQTTDASWTARLRAWESRPS